MTPLKSAMVEASIGVSWEYPCLIWIADYLLEATGQDIAEGWRRDWTMRTARAALGELAAGGQGETLVEQAMDRLASEHGWAETDHHRQGAVMVGIYRHASENGSTAIFDGESRWIVPLAGNGWASTGVFPDRAWEVECAH